MSQSVATRTPVVAVVERDPDILTGLRRLLHRHRREWDLHFFPSVQELESAQVRCDVLVASRPDPDAMAAQIRRGGASLRLCLSEAMTTGDVARAASWAHRYLMKPCPSEIVVAELRSLVGLWTDVPGEIIDQLGAHPLPASPTLYHRLARAIDDPDVSMNYVGALVESDPGMTLQILKLVNSSMFCGSRPVSAVVEAVKRLGAGVIRDLVLTTAIGGDSAARFQAHALAVADLVRRIPGPDRDAAFTAALLHDVGEQVQNAPEHGSDPSHAAMGAFMLAVWSLPPAVCDAVRTHHDPNPTGIAARVQLADRLRMEVEQNRLDRSVPALAESVGVSDRQLVTLRRRAREAA